MPVPHQAVDFDGDGRSDLAVSRTTNSPGAGQRRWYIQSGSMGDVPEGPGANSEFDWGLAGDVDVPLDYDNDNKTDIAVWRGSAGQFYILRSSNGTLRLENLGQTGDDPTVSGDYTGDGAADPAVYRPGASSTFRYIGVGGATVIVNWGVNGDFRCPGDYNGDGRTDFCVQRADPNSPSQARFYILNGTGVAGAQGTESTVQFGIPSDLVVPGDYDRDGRTDLAIARYAAGHPILWFIRPSSTGVISGGPTAIYGQSNTDFTVQGDYDRDGRTDIAVWRPNADPTQNFFYILGSQAGDRRFEWGQNGDFPVANFNSH